MICYLDTSALLRRVFGERPVLGIWGRWSEAYSSELARIEAMRTFDRMRLKRELDDEELADSVQVLGAILAHIGEIHITRPILARCTQAFPTPIKTLDALHLATAMRWREQSNQEITFVTHDAQQATAARVLGFRVET